jgi:hypothetical protein
MPVTGNITGSTGIIWHANHYTSRHKTACLFRLIKDVACWACKLLVLNNHNSGTALLLSAVE